MIDTAPPIASLEWTALAGESIFITGGTGFFGSALLYSFLEATEHQDLKVKVTVLTRSIANFKQNHPKLFDSKFIDYIEGNILDFSFPKTSYSKIFHLAATVASETFHGEDQLKKFKLFLDGTERVLQFATYCHADKVIFTSSGMVYGDLPKDMYAVTESYLGAPETTNPLSAVAEGKRCAEFLIAYYADRYGFEYVIARCFSFIGPNLPIDIHYAVGNFVRDALFNDRIEVKGDGSPIRSYLDVNDLIIWLLRLLSHKCKYPVYNVGSDIPISIKQLAYLVRDIIAPSKNVWLQGESNFSIGHLARNIYIPNIERARNEHQLDVWTGLDSAIKQMYRANKIS